MVAKYEGADKVSFPESAGFKAKAVEPFHVDAADGAGGALDAARDKVDDGSAGYAEPDGLQLVADPAYPELLFGNAHADDEDVGVLFVDVANDGHLLLFGEEAVVCAVDADVGVLCGELLNGIAYVRGRAADYVKGERFADAQLYYFGYQVGAVEVVVKTNVVELGEESDADAVIEDEVGAVERCVIFLVFLGNVEAVGVDKEEGFAWGSLQGLFAGFERLGFT